MLPRPAIHPRPSDLRRALLACAALASLGTLLLSAPATAADRVCRQWKAPALMEVTQTTLGGLPVYFQLRQTGSQLLGWAQYQTTRKTVIGNVVGNVSGNGIYLRVLWTYSGDPSIGRYTGTIKPRIGGIVGDTQYGDVFEGSTYDEYRNPPEYAYWNAHHFTCPLDPVPPPIALGRVATREDGPRPSICDAARSARARNSPAAPGLERQCLASGGSLAPPDPDGSRPLAALALATNEPARDAASMRVNELARVDPARVDALAAVGAAMAPSDPELASARVADADAAYTRGFDVASGLFGDPGLGAQGNTLMGPGSQRIRDSLDEGGRRGFDASFAFHRARSDAR
jgi:hypothetical protein